MSTKIADTNAKFYTPEEFGEMFKKGWDGLNKVVYNKMNLEKMNIIC